MDIARYNHKRVIVCCNLLPVDIKYNEATQNWDCTLDKSSLYEDGSMYVEIGRVLKAKSDLNVVFVGCTKTYVPKSEQMKVERKLELLNCYPIWLDKKVASRYYQGYCRTILYPVFHNIIELYGDHLGEQRSDPETDNWNWMPKTSYSISFAAECWEDYCEVNRLFSLRVKQLFQKRDVVWVHDYHLLILPSFLFRKITEAPVIFSLHSPFPSTECFRFLVHREDILKAMLCADMVAFHSYDYTRSFLLSCKRMLGLKCEPQVGAVVEVHYQSRSIRVLSTLVSLQPSFITQRLPATLSQPGKGLEFHRDCKKAHGIPVRKCMFLSIDELDASSGITARLVSILKFMSLYKHTEFPKKIFFKMIAITPDSSPDKYKREKANVETMVEKINTKFGKIIDYSEVESVPLAKRIELYNASDCLLLTSVVRNLSTTPFEYRYATQYHPGCILISEFEAVSRVLPGAITYTPVKGNGFASAVAEVVQMKLQERMARSARDLFSIKKTLHDWCMTILLNTFEASKRNLINNNTPEVFGLGLNLSLMTRKTKKRSGLKWLDSSKLMEAYTNTKHRLIIFDYSGTLVGVSALSSQLKDGGEAKTWHYEDKNYKKESHQSTAPCLETRQFLADEDKQSIAILASDPANHVVIVSSDLRDEVEHVLLDIPNLTLVAENGYTFKMKDSDTWESVIDEKGSGLWYSNANTSSNTKLASITLPDNPELEDLDWQKDIYEYMSYYQLLVNGSYCWTSPSSVIFNFYLADPEWGSIAADSLYKGLEGKLAGLPLSMEKGKGYVTVRLAGVNRGAATAAILAKINRKLRLLSAEEEEMVDFVFCGGDDIEDEVNFETVLKYKAKDNNKAKVFNTRVGYTKSKQTKAKYFVDEPSDLMQTLKNLVSTNHGDEDKDPSIDASQFITKKSMLNLASVKVENSSTTLDTTNSFESGYETPKGPSVTFDLQAKWGNSDSWALEPSDKVFKSSGLTAKAPLRKNRGLKKNVSFKDIRQGVERRDSLSFEEKKLKNQSSPNLALLAAQAEAQQTPKRRVIAHSPSYIATPEELEELFGGANKLATDKPATMETKLGDNMYDVGVPDRRKIPPTAKKFTYDLSENVKRTRSNSLGRGKVKAKRTQRKPEPSPVSVAAVPGLIGACIGFTGGYVLFRMLNRK